VWTPELIGPFLPSVRRTVIVAEGPPVLPYQPKGHRVGLRIVLCEVCTAFTRVTPAHTRCHLIVTRIPKASASSLPPWVLRLLPAGAFWRVGFTLIGKRRLSTARTRTGRRGALCLDVGSLITLAHLLFRRSRGALTRRAKYRRAQVGDPHLDVGIGWTCVATAPLGAARGSLLA
jgi:hypothetical protein